MTNERATYLGVDVNIAPNDPEHRQWLEAAAEGRLALQQCTDCEKLRYPVGNRLPLLHIARLAVV